MSELYKVCASAVVSLLAVLLLRQTEQSFGELAGVFFGVCIMSRVILGIAEIWDYLRAITGTSLEEARLGTLLKAAAIALATDFTADICRDAGVGNIASCVELFGRCELILLSLPLVTELIGLAFTLLRL